MNGSNPKPEDLQAEYQRRRDAVLISLAKSLEAHISELMDGEPRIDRITARAKTVESYLKKAATPVNGTPKYNDPLNQIQDQIGARIVVFYKSDVSRIEQRIKKYLTPIEFKDVVPDEESEFGYFGYHMILVLPSDVISPDMDRNLMPSVFELQIKTLFQHAWSEADHDLGYKPGENPLTSDQKRLVAFTSAQAWGADHIFDRLFSERIPAGA